MGVDLAGSVKRKTGLALLDGLLKCRYVTVYTDGDIIKMALEEDPDVIVIDAPAGEEGYR